MSGRTRTSSDERREQIARAALELLADTPVSSLGTRQIAKRVGISQPALFRHFRSREAILLATIALSRRELGGLAESVLEQQAAALDRLGALAQGILRHVEQNPGLPRLLMSDPHHHGEPLRQALKHLLSMQQAFARELIRQAQREGTVRASLDVERAAASFVGNLQGAVLQWQVAERQTGLGAEAAPLFQLWLHGAAAEPSTHAPEPVAALPAPDRAEAAGTIVALDVRALLASGVDPLDHILANLDAVGPDGVLKLTAPFRPGPLLTLLRTRGYQVEAQEIDARRWEVEARAPAAPEVMDLRDLEAPEPLERLLVAVERLASGEALLARTPRMPRLLLARLAERGVDAVAHEEPDKSGLVMARRR